MLDSNLLREHPERIRQNLISRGYPIEDFDKSLGFLGKRKKTILETEQLRQLQNTVSREIAQLKKEKKDASRKVSEMKKVSDKIKDLSQELSEIETHVEQMLMELPNLLDASVPVGKHADDNVEIRKWGKIPKFSFEPKDHLTLGEQLNIIDVKRAAKIAGARFALYRDLGAKLERGLINLMLDINTKESGYTEIFPPLLVNRDAMTGTGQLPKFSDDLFKIEQTDFFLIPTAEVPLCNIYRDEIVPPEILPIRLTAYTPCFRKEAGSYGKDVKGLIRQHQFNKVEIIKIVEPETSDRELETLTEDAEKILQRLELPYRVVTLCSADTGFASAKTYDIEVWLPSQNRYREISSCSNCKDFQARRMKLRYRPTQTTKPRYPHTLNGSALAVGRTLIAILENFQKKDGSVEIPMALRPYVGTDLIKLP